MTAYAIGSKRNCNWVGNCFWDWSGARGRVRFDSALAEHWTLPRRADARDLLTIAQSEMRPRLSGISRFVNAVANRKIRAMQPFAAANANDVRI